MSEEALEAAARLVGRSRYTIALVGAGISVESGIPPFRGPEGLWTKYGEPDLAGFQRFLADPQQWWEEWLTMEREGPYRELHEAMERALPNAGHIALAELEEQGLLKHTITQNADNLHQEAGSRSITEIHGNRLKLRCLDCHSRFPLAEFSLEVLPPKCPNCGGVVKTDIVMFGEPIPADALQRCHEETYRCDCMLLVGTSALVYPAADFPVIAKRRGANLIEANPRETALTDLCDVVLSGAAGTVLPRLVMKVRENEGLEKGL
ncbi:MAG TPA: NAD-dependent deacylase [Dehalococcoidia bacterium]|nr:NAD-dependent deacylase [Dehalococcoidia bacterium]